MAHTRIGTLFSGLAAGFAILVSGAAAFAGPAPINLRPANTASDVSIHPALEIDHDDPAVVSAQYQIATAVDFASPLYDSGESENDLFAHLVRADLPSLTLFHWRARVKEASGVWSDWSAPTAFRTIDAARLGSYGFRAGENAYDGAADTDLRGSALNPLVAIREWNQGAQDVVRIGRRPPGSATDEIYRTLLRFDLAAFDPGDPVINAWVELTGWQHDDETVSTRRASLFEVYRPWGEGAGTTGGSPELGESSWTYSEFAATWGLAGCADAADGDPLADRAATPLLRLSPRNEIGHKTYWSSAALAEAVQRWILDPAGNRGLLLRCDDESIRRVVNIASREHPDLDFRPKLVIETLLTPPNLPPVAANDTAKTSAGVAVDVDVLANDADADAAPAALAIADVADPPNGTASVVSGLVRYEPDPGFVGADTFAYTITDGEDSDSATLRVQVTHREWIEAETAVLTAPMEIATDDAGASGGAHVVVPEGTGDVFDPGAPSGAAEITFTVPIDSTYAIWGRARAMGRGSDSFFVSVDGGPFLLWRVPGGPGRAKKDAVPLDPAGALTSGNYPGWSLPWRTVAPVVDPGPWVFGPIGPRLGMTPLAFDLAAGVHTIRIQQREDGTPLDRLFITDDLDAVP